MLNSVNGTYLHAFRINESVDTSYTKTNGVDDSGFNFVVPEQGVPYVGWTEIMAPLEHREWIGQGFS